MKTSSFTKQQLIDKLIYEGFKETHKGFWYKRTGRVDYSYTLFNKHYVYLEREEPLKEGWWREDRKYKNT